ALVLFVEPRFERAEVFENGGSVHLLRAGEVLERIGPRPASPPPAHGGGALPPSLSMAAYFAPAALLLKIEHSCSGPLNPAASHSALWNWNCRMNDRK